MGLAYTSGGPSSSSAQTVQDAVAQTEMRRVEITYTS